MNTSGVPSHKDRHLESDACSHQEREELRHAFSVARTGLQQESRDRILCERRGQTAHGVVEIGRGGGSDFHDA